MRSAQAAPWHPKNAPAATPQSTAHRLPQHWRATVFIKLRLRIPLLRLQVGRQQKPCTLSAIASQPQSLQLRPQVNCYGRAGPHFVPSPQSGPSPCSAASCGQQAIPCRLLACTQTQEDKSSRASAWRRPTRTTAPAWGTPAKPNQRAPHINSQTPLAQFQRSFKAIY